MKPRYSKVLICDVRKVYRMIGLFDYATFASFDDDDDDDDDVDDNNNNNDDDDD